MPLSLVKRLVLGVPIPPSVEDNNKTLIENAINGFSSQLAASLNPDGTLKANTVDTNSIQNRAVTLAKLAYNSCFYAQDGGAANAIAITFTPTLGTPYSGGMLFFVRVVASNTGATTLAVATQAPSAVKKFTSSGLVDLATGDLIANGVYAFCHDGTQFILLNPTPVSPGVGTGPVFLPVSVPVYSGGAMAWGPVFDASLSIPANAKASILYCSTQVGPAVDGEVRIDIRPDVGGPTLIACRTGGIHGVASLSSQQGQYPITASRHFQYQVVETSVGSAATITLVGYVL